MNESTLQRFALVGTLSLWLLACDDSSSPTAPVEEEEVVEVETLTESFSGTLALGETSCHDFSTLQLGDIDMTITSLAPLDTLTVGMGIGTEDSESAEGCAIFASDSSVRVGDVLRSVQLAAGEYCLCVFDVGNIFASETVSYSAEVTHP